MAYNTAYDLESLMVNTKAATVYSAHENSLFLGGVLIPAVNLPAGSITAQIPVMGSVTAEKITSADPDASRQNQDSPRCQKMPGWCAAYRGQVEPRARARTG